MPSHLSWRRGEGFGLIFKQNFKELVLHPPSVIMYMVMKETFSAELFATVLPHTNIYTIHWCCICFRVRNMFLYMAIQTFNIRKWFTGTARPKTNRIFQFFFFSLIPFSYLSKINRKSASVFSPTSLIFFLHSSNIFTLLWRAFSSLDCCLVILRSSSLDITANVWPGFSFAVDSSFFSSSDFW